MWRDRTSHHRSVHGAGRHDIQIQIREVTSNSMLSVAWHHAKAARGDKNILLFFQSRPLDESVDTKVLHKKEQLIQLMSGSTCQNLTISTRTSPDKATESESRAVSLNKSTETMFLSQSCSCSINLKDLNLEHILSAIEAVKFLLGSFFDDPSEVERKELIKKEFLTNSRIKTCARFSEASAWYSSESTQWWVMVLIDAIVFILMSFCQFT